MDIGTVTVIEPTSGKRLDYQMQTFPQMFALANMFEGMGFRCLMNVSHVADITEAGTNWQDNRK